jgi:signal transduction histidine kinase
VTASSEPGSLVLVVQDTGVGNTHTVTPAAPIVTPAKAGAQGGFGLTQIRERLATVYGDAASFSIAHSDQGTRAEIRLPP